MDQSTINGMISGVSLFIITGGLKWIGTKVNRTWLSLTEQMKLQTTKIDDIKKVTDNLTGKFGELQHQVDQKDAKIAILWDERNRRFNRDQDA